ncbi:hypothetical protein DOK67_0001159 [Enterococcus sp. DIV0212c]|uniref:thioredoxin family protein n=1 Tax=Enterococcus sp. DIV0212c TaxID=2230867 RepID=UPI001A9C21ED|nr:thioredoxin family protein [Enterococcus sp. DIV0212c]MBO1354516.1 thioredoxin [Enterococcus sp. DIV0212c]
MKKKVIYAALLTAIFGANLFTANHAYSLSAQVEEKETELVESKRSYPQIYNHLDAITLNTFENKVANQESFYVYVGRPTCGDCNDFEPDLIKLVKMHKLEDQLLYLNVAELRTNETKWESFKKTYDLIYTPTIAKFVNGKLDSKVEWTPEKGISVEQVNKWITDNVEKSK